MPLILVVEQEKRYVERIEEALGPQGWEVVGVDDRSAAMRHVADRAADLVVVNSEVNESSELIAAFARANGGPGAVVLVPESDNGAVPPESDEVLRKPFTDQDLRLAVRRCLAASREPEEAQAEAEPPSELRLSSEDIFGDVVMELEGAFNLGGASEATEDAEASAAEVTEEPDDVEEEAAVAAPEEAEPVVEVEVVAEEEAEEAAEPTDTAAEVDAALEGLEAEPEAEAEPVAEEPDADEPSEVEVAADEPAEEEPVEAAAEEPAEEPEPVEDEMVAAAPAEDEVTEDDLADEEDVAAEELSAAEEAVEDEVEAVEETVAADEVVEDEVAEEKAEPRKPKKKLLEERLHEALAEGKAMSASGESRPTPPPTDAGKSADLLLQKALATLGTGTPTATRIDDEFAAPAHATAEEVDALVGTVVGKKKPVIEPPAAEDESQAAVEPSEDAEEVPSLDVTESDLLDSDEGEYRTRMKILWVVILVILAALVVFMVTRPSDDDPAAEPSSPVSAGEAEDAVTGPGGEMEAPVEETAEPAEDGAEGGATDGAQEVPTDEVAELERRLRQELEAEQYELQAEVARSRGGARSTQLEEDGDGAQAPAS